MEREAFLARVREAAAAGRAFPVALNPEATAEASYVGGGDDPVATFLREWIAVGGQGERVTGLAGLLDYMTRLLGRYQVRTALVWKHAVLEKFAVADWLKQHSVIPHRWDELEQQPADQRWSQTFAADLGITSVDWAVAETGSLAVCSGLGQGRSVSLVPPVHLTILEPSQIVPDLFDLFRELDARKADLPAGLSLITGPSKTGDIQLQLTTGVHGPGEVHAVVVES